MSQYSSVSASPADGGKAYQSVTASTPPSPRTAGTPREKRHSSTPAFNMDDMVYFYYDHARGEVLDIRSELSRDSGAEPDAAAGGMPNASAGQGNRCDACPHCADVCCLDYSNPLALASAPTVCEACHSKNIDTAPASEVVVPAHAKPSRRPSRRAASPSGTVRRITPCEVARHKCIGSAWLVLGRDVLDVTSVILDHPGGIRSILRRVGTAKDCSADFMFHSAATRKRWKALKVGELVACPGHPNALPPLAPDSIAQQGDCTIS
jgi:cytochrome b involved in lipid metabolism